MKKLVLIGMPGCGKTTLGRRLAEKLRWEFLDADIILEQREQRTIKSFFAEGEDVFRAAETRTLRFLADREDVVLATGGGAVVREENMQLLRTGGHIIFLDRNPDNILQQLDAAVRPLLAVDKQRIYDLYTQRLELYRRYADYTVDNNTTEEKALQELWQIYLFLRGAEL